MAGKSLDFLKLCKEYHLDFEIIEKHDPEYTLNITIKNLDNSEYFVYFISPYDNDMWGNLIDYIIKIKKTKDHKFFKSNTDHFNNL